jgi:hypothetical protein
VVAHVQADGPCFEGRIIGAGVYYGASATPALVVLVPFLVPVLTCVMEVIGEVPCVEDVMYPLIKVSALCGIPSGAGFLHGGIR